MEVVTVFQRLPVITTAMAAQKAVSGGKFTGLVCARSDLFSPFPKTEQLQLVDNYTEIMRKLKFFFFFSSLFGSSHIIPVHVCTSVLIVCTNSL